jgi:RNA polymerase sigma-70 factor (ECF subfamily)
VTESVFDTILDEHTGLISRIVATFETNSAICDDLKQEVALALALWRATPSWRGDCTLRTFVARVTHNVCVSHVRRAVREPSRSELSDTLPSDREGPEDSVARADLSRRLTAAVATLPTGLREVATLTLEGFSTQEIAQTLGINEGAVYTRATRARAALREAMVTQ